MQYYRNVWAWRAALACGATPYDNVRALLYDTTGMRLVLVLVCARGVQSGFNVVLYEYSYEYKYQSAIVK